MALATFRPSRTSMARAAGEGSAATRIISGVSQAKRQRDQRGTGHGHRGRLLALTSILLLAGCGTAVGTQAPGDPDEGSAPSSSATARSSGSAVVSPSPSPALSLYPVPSSRLPNTSGNALRLDRDAAEALQRVLDQLRSDDSLPGLQAAIVFPDGTIWNGEAGLAITASNAPMASDTLMSVASVSKTFVAALVGRLAQRGVLSLDDHLDRYVPSFPNAGDVTLRELLNHTSGIQDVFDAPGLADAIVDYPTRIWTPDQILARIGQPNFRPGTAYRYSNTDFLLLGKVVEKATDRTVADLVRSEFLSPLDLNHTYLQTEESVEGTLAHGYMGSARWPQDNFAGTMIPFNAEASSVGCAGAYVSTASDLARWASALYGGLILDQATLADMVDITQTTSFASKPKTPYGLGFEELPVDGQLAWGHRGHLDGFWSAMEYLPDYDLTVVTLTNGEWASPVDLDAALVGVLLPPSTSPPPA